MGNLCDRSDSAPEKEKNHPTSWEKRHTIDLERFVPVPSASRQRLGSSTTSRTHVCVDGAATVILDAARQIAVPATIVPPVENPLTIDVKLCL
jgi:hypothetical protein